MYVYKRKIRGSYLEYGSLKNSFVFFSGYWKWFNCFVTSLIIWSSWQKKNPLDPAISCRDLIQVWRDLIVIWPDLDKSGQITTPATKLETDRYNSKPDDPTSIPSWFGVLFSPTQKFRVKFGSGTKPTWPNPWTALEVFNNLPNVKQLLTFFFLINIIVANTITDSPYTKFK